MTSTRLALLFPPFCHPTSPPLGIACLKVYLSARLPLLNIRCFDLNLAAYEQALSWMESGRLKLSLYDWSPERTAGELRRTSIFFKAPPEESGFFDLTRYSHHANLLLSFERVLGAFAIDMGRRELLGAPCPPALSRFWQELVAPVREFSPDWVGLSVLFGEQLHPALLLAHVLRQGLPGIKTVLGGAWLGVEAEPEAILEKGREITIGNKRLKLEPWRYIDLLIPGEGELPLETLLGSNGEQVDDIPSAIRRDAGGAAVTNPPRALPSLDDLPTPDFDDLPPRNYWSPRSVIPYLTSRGCYWRKCAFCTHHHSYSSYRERSVENCIDDISLLSDRYNAVDFHFYDEMLHPRRIEALAAGIKKRGLMIRFAAYAKPTATFDRDRLNRAFEGGCRLLMWGVESGSQRVLDLMCKGTDIETVGKVLRDANEAGIGNLTFILFGFPSETEEELYATLEFLDGHRNSIQALSKGTFILNAGSPVFNNPETFGISRIWKEDDGGKTASQSYGYSVSHGLNPEEVASLYRKSLGRLGGIGLHPRFGTYRDHLLLYCAYRPDILSILPEKTRVGKA